MESAGRIPDLVQRLAGVAASEGLTVATAESCTGGLLAAAITAMPGASSFFAGGVVAYSDEAKIGQLGVAPGDLRDHGAVSREVAVAMAQGACRRFAAGLAMAATGIAGPSGGTSAKPVGTVWIAVALPGLHEVQRMRFGGDRRAVQEQSVAAALSMAADFAVRDGRPPDLPVAGPLPADP